MAIAALLVDCGTDEPPPPAPASVADAIELVIVVGVCAFCAGVAAPFLKETAPRKVSMAQGQRAAEYRRAA